MSQGPYLFDVGPIALAHAGTPVSDTSLDYVRSAINGDIEAIVPYPAIIGAHHVLRGNYYLKNETASELMSNFIDAGNIYWYEDISRGTIERALSYSGEYNIEGWDGYYTTVAMNTGARTILTIDERLERIDDLNVEYMLTEAQHITLNEFLEEINEAEDISGRFNK